MEIVVFNLVRPAVLNGGSLLVAGQQTVTEPLTSVEQLSSEVSVPHCKSDYIHFRPHYTAVLSQQWCLQLTEHQQPNSPQSCISKVTFKPGCVWRVNFCQIYRNTVERCALTCKIQLFTSVILEEPRD